MHQAIPHPAGLFSGRVAARLAAPGWASGARRAPPRLGRRGMVALVVGLHLGLILLGAQLLREVAALRQARPATQAIAWPSDELAPAPRPALSPEAFPDQPPAAPEGDAAPAPTAPEFAPPAPSAPTGRIADAPAPTAQPAPATDTLEPGRTRIAVVATGYCPCALCCGEYADGFTAIMRDARRHRGIAVDPRLIAYRTMLTVPGYGTAMVDDTGEAMRRDGARGVVHLDLRFRTHEQAKAWGVRRVIVEVPADSRAAALGGALAAADQDTDNTR